MTTSTTPRGKMPLNLWAAVLCVPLLLIAFRQAIADLLGSWEKQEYSHGYFIPFITALLVWHRLAARPAVLKPSWLGLAFLAVAGGLQFITQLSAFVMAAQYGFLIALFGVALACLGKQATRTMTPALVYLIFAIPLPHLIQADLSQGLQLLSSSLGVWVLDMIGVAVFQDGNVIDLGGYRLQVVEACNGLRYLFPLMSFGYLVALLIEDRLWKRVIVFASTIPISIGLNALRIALIGITVDRWGESMAEGFIHDFEGWVVFMICLGLLMLESWFLMRLGRAHGRFRFEVVALPRGRIHAGATPSKAPIIAALITTIAFVLVFGSSQIKPIAEIIPRHPPFASFPLRLADWQGRDDAMPTDVLQALKLSDYWLADYKRPEDKTPVNLYIAYYDSQMVGTTTHSPSNCIPGGGWKIEDRHVKTLTLASGEIFGVTRLLIRKDRASQIVYYWFDERGRKLTETTFAKIYLLWDSIKMRRSDGALVRLVTSIPDSNNEAEGDDRLINFLNQAYPAIINFIPGAVVAKSQ